MITPPFPDEIKAFIHACQWTYAKTMPKWLMNTLYVTEWMRTCL